MTEMSYQLIESGRRVPIKAWTRGVPLEPEAQQQLRNVAALPIVYKWVAVMPDVHWGMGATIGSVIPTKRDMNAIFPPPMRRKIPGLPVPWPNRQG
jgi:tRNA-splicing ligase RtcB